LRCLVEPPIIDKTRRVFINPECDPGLGMFFEVRKSIYDNHFRMGVQITCGKLTGTLNKVNRPDGRGCGYSRIRA
jgi:hypothetical protein